MASTTADEATATPAATAEVAEETSESESGFERTISIEELKEKWAEAQPAIHVVLFKLGTHAQEKKGVHPATRELETSRGRGQLAPETKVGFVGQAKPLLCGSFELRSR